MSRFFTHNLSAPGQAGENLREERQRHGFSLEQVSHNLRIPVKYLQALEQDDDAALPAGNYHRYFMRSYAAFLRLSADDLVLADKKPAPPVPIRARRPIKIASVTMHPYRLLLAAAAGLTVVVYLASAAWSALVPPHLQLLKPDNDQTSLTATIEVRGQTQAGTPIVINGQAVPVSESGGFNQEVPLKPGLNVIVVTAQKTYSQPTTITRRVVFLPPRPVSLIK